MRPSHGLLVNWRTLATLTLLAASCASSVLHPSDGDAGLEADAGALGPDLDGVRDGHNDCNGQLDDGFTCDGLPNNEDCTDLDRDGYGAGCAAGTDCDDNDPQRFPGAPEACDGKDNDCDGATDEDHPLGEACTEGQGICAANGTTVCGADGTSAVCDAPVGQPQAEVCDRLDNDCDGTADEGITCPTCIEDDYEPNDSSPVGTPLTSGSKNGHLCPGNRDWFALGTYNVGSTVSVAVDFVHAGGDIQLEMFVDGAFVAASAGSGDGESITHTLSSSGRVDVYVYLRGSPPASGNSYTIRRP